MDLWNFTCTLKKTNFLGSLKTCDRLYIKLSNLYTYGNTKELLSGTLWIAQAWLCIQHGRRRSIINTNDVDMKPIHIKRKKGGPQLQFKDPRLARSEKVTSRHNNPEGGYVWSNWRYAHKIVCNWNFYNGSRRIEPAHQTVQQGIYFKGAQKQREPVNENINMCSRGLL